MHNFLKCI